MNENPPAPPPVKKEDAAAPAKYSSPPYVWTAAVVLAVLIYFGLGYLADTFTHESTDDAFIAGHTVSIAPRIAGQVAAVYVLDNQMVHSNDLLVEIDPADYAIAMAQKVTTADAQQASFKTMYAGWQLMQAKVTTAEADLRKAQADAESAASTAEDAQSNFDRAQDLVAQKTISQQEFDDRQAANTKAQADLKSAQENVAESSSKVDEANRSLDAAWAQVGTVKAQWEEAQTNVAASQINLSYTKLFAPCDGRVTRKAVEPGDYLQVAQQVMSLVPTEVWVIANFKESQLNKMRTNQPVSVEIDALGGRKFRAHVDSVQAGSGAAFSLLPPENATGNFVKVIQRVPVKIVFDDPLPADHTIGPGLSVTPDVQVSDWAVPAWLVAIVAITVSIGAALTYLSLSGRKTAGD